MKGLTVTLDKVAAFLAAAETLSTSEVLIGIPDDSDNNREDGPISNAALGFIHEHGSPMRNIPARPFLVPGVRAAAPKIADALKSPLKDTLSGVNKVKQGLTAAGLIAQSSVKNRIRTSVGIAPLQQSTIAARLRDGKQGTKPLIRTGQLLNSIKFVIRDK